MAPSSAVASVARGRRRVRRGRLHHRDDRLPGDRHRPELRGAARLLHGVDGRATTASPPSAASRASRTRARCSCAPSAARSGPTGCASTASSRLDGIDTRSLVLRLRDAGAMRAAAVADEGALPATTRWSRYARSRRWKVRRSSRRSRRPSRTCSPRKARRASRSSTTARSARSCGDSRRPAPR